MQRQDLDELQSAQVVCRITLTMDRIGNMKVDGSITDEKIALMMLDTARDVVKSFHAKRRAGSPIIVPAHDTAMAI